MIRFSFIFSALALLVACCLGCQNKASSSKTVTVIATAVPHAEILEVAQQELQDQGIVLKVIVIDDYNIPNRAVVDGEADANFFQHLPFLEQQKNDFQYALVPIASVSVAPMGLYSKKWDSLDQLPEKAVLALPSDPTNQARALMLFERAGLIRLSRHDTKASVLDIKSNPKKYRFQTMDAAFLVRAIDEVDLAAINSNYALQAGLNPVEQALVLEKGDSLFINVLVVREGEEERPELQALKKALTSDRVREFIIVHYQGAVLPGF